MGKSKATVKTVDAVPVPSAEMDNLYQDYLAKALSLNKELEKSRLMWYWKMGDLVIKFTESQTNHELGSRTLDHLVSDLAKQDCPIAVAKSTLYCARQIREHYQLGNLPDMVEHGFLVSHLKLMMPQEPEIEAAVAKRMVNPDGSVVTVRELKNIIDETKKEAIVADVNKSLDKVQKDREAPKSVTYSSADEEDSEALKTPEKGEHRSSKAKEFTVNPLKAFKTFDKHGIALLACLGDALLAGYEGTKVGFDSDRAQKNFKDGLEGALGTAEQLLEPLQKFIKELKSVRKDV